MHILHLLLVISGCEDILLFRHSALSESLKNGCYRMANLGINTSECVKTFLRRKQASAEKMDHWLAGVSSTPIMSVLPERLSEAGEENHLCTHWVLIRNMDKATA